MNRRRVMCRRSIGLATAACLAVLAAGLVIARPQSGSAGGSATLSGASAADGGAAKAGAFSISRLGWIAGHWLLESGNRATEEHWIPPEGGIMLGVSRTLREGQLVEYELVLIAERDGKLVYEAHPSGQETAEFTAIQLTDTSVVFENLAHDFPQRVIYRKHGADTLIARVEGTTEKGARGSDFPYRRIAAGP